MKAHSQVDGDEECLTLEWFWDIVHSFTPDEKAMLLQFATGSPVLPPGGFESLFPPLTISITPPHRGRLPSAYTWYVYCIQQEYKSCCEWVLSLLAVLTSSTFQSVNRGWSYVCKLITCSWHQPSVVSLATVACARSISRPLQLCTSRRRWQHLGQLKFELLPHVHFI